MNRKTVSLCLIARDEEASIGTTIKSVLALVDEVIVVDTGSRDNTRIIAEGYGARVLDVTWEDDFSTARNAALNEALSDWVLVLDADEFLQPVRPVDFQRLLHNPAVAGYRLRMASPIGEETMPGPSMIRLFRNDETVRYRYPIFEQVRDSLEAWAQQEGLHIAESDLTVVHETGKPGQLARKRERNQRILRKAMAAYPQEPYFPYKMGSAGLNIQDEEVLPTGGLSIALGHLHTSWQRLSGWDAETLRRQPWLPDLGAKSISGLLALDKVAEARALTARLRELFPQHPRILLQDAVVRIRHLEMTRRETEAGAFEAERLTIEKQLLMLRELPEDLRLVANDRRLFDLYPLRYLGELALLSGRVSEAVGHFEQALSLDPGYSSGWLGMAECSRFAGDRKRALKLYLRTITENEWNHRGWLQGCDLMREMDFQDNASSWWRRFVTQFPEHPAAAQEDGRPLGNALALHPVG